MEGETNSLCGAICCTVIRRHEQNMSSVLVDQAALEYLNEHRRILKCTVRFWSGFYSLTLSEAVISEFKNGTCSQFSQDLVIELAFILTMTSAL